MTGRLCLACWLRPVRRASSKVPVPFYCWPCMAGEDQQPWDYDLRFGWHTRNVVRAEHARRRRRVRDGQALQARAETLLARLRGRDRRVWQLVVDGLSERRIAVELGLTRQRLYSQYLARLRAAAGIRARPRRYTGRQAA